MHDAGEAADLAPQLERGVELALLAVVEAQHVAQGALAQHGAELQAGQEHKPWWGAAHHRLSASRKQVAPWHSMAQARHRQGVVRCSVTHAQSAEGQLGAWSSSGLHCSWALHCRAERGQGLVRRRATTTCIAAWPRTAGKAGVACVGVPPTRWCMAGYSSYCKLAAHWKRAHTDPVSMNPLGRYAEFLVKITCSTTLVCLTGSQHRSPAAFRRNSQGF